MHFRDAPMLPTASRFGHLAEVRRDPFGLLERACAERGGLVRLRLPGGPIGVVLSPAYLHEVLVTKAKSFEKSPVLRIVLEPLAGLGLFTSEGELWRKQRRVMAPLFQHHELERYAACMQACAEQAASEWRDGETIDVFRETTRITMSIAGRSLFDSDMFGDADEIGAAITTALAWANEASASLLIILQTRLRTRVMLAKDDLPAPVRGAAARLLDALERPILLPSRRSRELRAALDVLERRVERMIADRREGGPARADLLTALLRARDEDDGSRMSDKQVRDEILTLFIAGHETTATALAWSLHLLARHPEALRRARAEVDSLGGRRASFADLPKLGYCLKVFKEALRLYPPIYLFGRQAIADVQIGEHLVPRGAVLLVSPFIVHHRADVWPEPERFDPERFEPEAEAARPRSAFIPFSAGPRTCIGNHFALMEGPLVLATLLQRADLEPASGAAIRPEASATLRPKGGMPMRVRLRAGPAVG